MSSHLANTPPRIAVFSVEFPPGPGGIGTHAFQLARHLSSRGWDVSVVTPQDHASNDDISAFNRRLPFNLFPLHPVPCAPVEALYRLAKGLLHVARVRPDILVATGKRAAWVTYALSCLYRLPWVAVGHGSEFGTPSRFVQALMRWTYSRADAVVCVSDFTRTFLEASGIRPRHLSVIPNGADDETFHIQKPFETRSGAEALGLPASSRLILTVGNVCDRKGQDVVIRALPAVVRQIPDAHYLLAGLPTIRDRLATLAAELKVQDRVHFLGCVDTSTLVSLMNLCDVFALTSRRTPDGDIEGFGIAVVEAALCGKPAVVTAASGLSEAIEDGRTGLAVAEGDASAVADALIRLLSDEPLRRRMGEAAQLRAINEQTWSRRAVQYDELLTRVLLRPSIESAPSRQATPSQ